MIRNPSLAILAALGGCLLAAACSQHSNAAPAHSSGQVPRLEHIIVIVMENQNYDETRALPYVRRLIAGGSSFSRSYALTHPSQPNYLALWSGSTHGVRSNDCPLGPYSVENLGHACEAAGLRWKAYVEKLPKPGSRVCQASGSLYTRKHAPWTNFGNLNHANERPYTDLARDIAGDSLPHLAFVIPDNCHNAHDKDDGCTLEKADAWLAANVPAMLRAVGPRGIVVITCDEDDSDSGNHILTVMSGTPVEPSYVSGARITHYTLLRTLCEALGLPPMGQAVRESAITDVWRKSR